MNDKFLKNVATICVIIGFVYGADAYMDTKHASKEIEIVVAGIVQQWDRASKLDTLRKDILYKRELLQLKGKEPLPWTTEYRTKYLNLEQEIERLEQELRRLEAE